MATVKLCSWMRVATLACVVLVMPLAALAASDAERLAAYKDFRAQFDARQYAAALPLAEKLVQLTEAQFGAEDMALTNPLTNLATVNYKLANHTVAIENYQRALRILQAKSTIADRQQIRPLHGLGLSFMAVDDPESAVVALKRAADLSRNVDGLFNIGQIEFIDSLVEAYAATGRYAEAEKEAVYALRVEEAAHGRASLALLPRLEKLARWYEYDRRFTTQRGIYERALNILTRTAGKNDLRRVGPLRGIARSYRLETYYGVEGAADGAPVFNAGTNGAPVFSEGSQQRRGESTLTAALAVVDANSPVDHQLRGEVLADLGDWYLTTNSRNRAYDSYAEAWKALAQVGNTRPLESPRLLAYRPSISSVDRSQLDPAEAVVKVVEMHFTVDRDGRVEDIRSPTTDVPEAVVRNVITSMRRSRYAPRIENGAAVATQDVMFREKVLVRESTPEPASSSGEAEEKPAESPAPTPEPAPEAPK